MTAVLLTLPACGTTYSTYYRGAAKEFRIPADYQPQAREYSPSERQPSSISPSVISDKDFALTWPVKRLQVNRGYRPERAPNHQGMDLGGQLGTPILAAHPGRIIYAGRDFRGYGKMVLIEYNDQWATLYGHLNRIGVNEGQIVNAGEEIGKMGRTGHASGVHLHFELIHKKQPIDPEPYFTKKHADNR